MFCKSSTSTVVLIVFDLFGSWWFAVISYTCFMRRFFLQVFFTRLQLLCQLAMADMPTRSSRKPQPPSRQLILKFLQLPPFYSGKNSVRSSWIRIVIRNITKIEWFAASETSRPSYKIQQH